jgi:NADPH:quinone reductase
MPNLPTQMRAIAIDSFGGLERLKLQTVAVPKLEAGEVLIRVAFADVAVWDVNEREGDFAEMSGRKPTFPLVLGSEGAGEVVAVGEGVASPKVGETVYAAGFLNPKGGFYGEYAVIKADAVGPVPKGMTLEQAGVFSGDGGTALRGLEDVLRVRPGESVMVFGAGGGLGHLAVQFAKRLGARVFAVASRKTGVDLVSRLGVDAVIDGREEDVVAAAKQFAPGGLDAALLTAGGEAAERALTALKPGGRAAYPHGVEPVPKAPAGVTLDAYDGNVDAPLIARMNDLIAKGPFTVHVAKIFPLEQAADAHRMLGEHYVGKIGLKIG